jgi:hypothetical protein
METEPLVDVGETGLPRGVHIQDSPIPKKDKVELFVSAVCDRVG